jgi:TolB protein
MLIRTIRLLALTAIAAGVLIVPASQPAMATFPGHNGLVVISDTGSQIATINSNGTGLHTITSFASFAEAPQASADGKWIVFDASNGGQKDLYKIHPNGSGQQQLTHNATYEWAPSFSPDGKLITFAKDGSCSDIWVVHSDGTHAHKLSGTHVGEFARYSPSGKKIVYGNCDGQIHVMNADGSHDHALTNFGTNKYPSWSPDGHKIVFNSTATGSNQAWIMNADGTHDHVITTVGISFGPVVSPSGTKLLYKSGSDIYVSSLTGASPQLVSATNECCFDWIAK